MAKPSLTKDLQFEKKNQDMVKLPKHAKVHKRPIPHAPVASPFAGASVPKIVYVSSTSPFMSAVKRVQKLLRQAEKRASASVNLSDTKKREQQKLAQVTRGEDQLRQERVFVKATGRAIEKALKVGRWFEQRDSEYVVDVKTGSVLVVDDVEEDEEAKQAALDELEKSKAQPREEGDDAVGSVQSAGSKSAVKKRKRAMNSRAAVEGQEEEELPETRTRWINMVEIAISFK